MTEILPHNEKAATTWSSPGEQYEEISRGIAEAIEHCIDRLQIRPCERVLDVACGTGWASRSIAHRIAGSDVSGIDIAAGLVEVARAAAARAGVTIEYRVGDAESLPYGDARFDVVISTFGVMFAAQPEVAARELARVTRPGGRVGLTTWKPDSTVVEFFNVMKPFLPPPPVPRPSPFEWGARERVRSLLGSAFMPRFEDGVSPFRAASARHAWDMWITAYGPTRTLAASLPADRRAQFEHDMLTFMGRFETELGISKPRDYLLTIATRN